jgi:hypothetical protein
MKLIQSIVWLAVLMTSVSVVASSWRPAHIIEVENRAAVTKQTMTITVDCKSLAQEYLTLLLRVSYNGISGQLGGVQCIG